MYEVNKMLISKQISSFFTDLVYSNQYKHAALFVNNVWRMRIEKGKITEVDFGYFDTNATTDKIEENISRYYENILFFNDYLPRIIEKFSNFHIEVDIRFNQLGIIEDDCFNVRGVYYFSETDFLSINDFFKSIQKEHPGIFQTRNMLQILCKNKNIIRFDFSYTYDPNVEEKPLQDFIIANNNHQISVIYNRSKLSTNCDFLLEINKEGQINSYKMRQLIRSKKGVI